MKNLGTSQLLNGEKTIIFFEEGDENRYPDPYVVSFAIKVKGSTFIENHSFKTKEEAQRYYAELTPHEAHRKAAIERFISTVAIGILPIPTGATTCTFKEDYEKCKEELYEFLNEDCSFYFSPTTAYLSTVNTTNYQEVHNELMYLLSTNVEDMRGHKTVLDFKLSQIPRIFKSDFGYLDIQGY